jgi:hypothetical protein
MSEWEWAPGSGKGSLIEAAGAGFCWEGRHPKADPSHHFVGMPRAYRGRARMSGLVEGGSPSSLSDLGSIHAGGSILPHI